MPTTRILMKSRPPKKRVTVPKDFTELFNVIKMYPGMATILFGAESEQAVGMGHTLALIKQEVSTIKVRIAGDFRYLAKIPYAFKIRIQRWLYLCEQQEDRLTINDSIIDMDQVIEQILNSSLSINLPLVFTTSDAQKIEGVILTPAGAGEQQQGGERRRAISAKGAARTTRRGESLTRARSTSSR
jgi:hypothetical protein